MNIMRRCAVVLCMTTALLLAGRTVVLAESNFDRKILSLIDKAVFEVVVLKPTSDSLTYERPLPLDLLPYGERTDKYLSLGTAFAISPTEYVTAAHVLALDRESQYKEYFLRDVNGAVFSIDEILKFSDRRDFAVFSVRGRNSGEYLLTNTRPELHDKVYAVGNALGEGIVIRDGLFTSTTPEDLNGEWKWLRFSAAASPGNSGGPLLDGTGRVIGIVLRKSPNENLNIALPIAEVVKAKDGVAQLDRKMYYFIDNMATTKIDILRHEITLPKPYRQLNQELTDAVDKFAAKLLERLLDENKSQIFPNGRESLPLLHKSYDAVFPFLIFRGADGIWDAQSAKETRDLELGNNGSVTVGYLGSSYFLYVQKPDNVQLETFYSDSKTFMDTILKGLGITRQIAVDKIRVTSFGKANEESVFTDGYRRKWLVRLWSMEYNDQRVVTFSLPVPGGCITMMRHDQTGRISGHIMDLKALADFVYVSYYGTLKQWREFLAMKALLPEVLSGIAIEFESGGTFRYGSRRLGFRAGKEILRLTENSDLKLNFGYFPEGGRIQWDVKDVVLGEDKNSATSFLVSRMTRPPDELSDRYKSEWEKMINRKMPYNKTSYLNEKTSVISTVYPEDMTGNLMGKARLLYRVSYTKEGNIGQEAMKAALDGFLKNIEVYELVNKQ